FLAGLGALASAINQCQHRAEHVFTTVLKFTYQHCFSSGLAKEESIQSQKRCEYQGGNDRPPQQSCPSIGIDTVLVQAGGGNQRPAIQASRRDKLILTIVNPPRPTLILRFG